MPKAEDLTGKRFGRLTVVKRVNKDNKKDRHTIWLCKCDCGNEKEISSASLKKGKTKSCGCLAKEVASKEKTKVLTGQRFGMLTVIERHGSKSGKAAWKCLCDCGKEKIVDGNSLSTGNTKSCGCLSGMKDITGVRFGKLVAVKPVENKNGYIWLCQCDCGKTRNVYITKLKNGVVFSCGCEQRKNKRNRKHGVSGTRIYKEYYGMISRCSPDTKYKKDYYDRGIAVCKEWKEDFLVFYEWSMNNGYTDNLSLDRIDNDKGYSPDNCRWATMKEQGNNRRNNTIIEYNGETHTLSEWAEIVGIESHVISQRIKRGWSTEKTFNTPTVKRNRKK